MAEVTVQCWSEVRQEWDSFTTMEREAADRFLADRTLNLTYRIKP